MKDLPYAIIVSGDNVFEVDLANHAPGSNLTSSITKISNTVDHFIRTVVMIRDMDGLSQNYYSFDPVK